MSIGNSCPYCRSTDICGRTDGRAECLDCEKDWQPGGRKRHRIDKRAARVRTWVADVHER